MPPDTSESHPKECYCAEKSPADLCKMKCVNLSEFMCDHMYLPLPAYTCLLVKFLSVLCGHLPGCVAALRALGILLAFAMISFQDLCTLRNILDSAGSCVLIPGAKKILSRNSQFLWHMSHSSWEGGKKEEREKEEIQGRLGKMWGQCKCEEN